MAGNMACHPSGMPDVRGSVFVHLSLMGCSGNFLSLGH